MRPKDLVDFVAVGQMNFKVELRFYIAKFFPRVPYLPGLLFGVVLRRASNNDRAGLKRSARAQDAFPQVIGRNHRKPDGLPALFGHGKGLRKQMLLDAAKKLIGVQFVFTGSRAAQQSDVQNNHVAASRFDAIENVAQVVEIEVVAHRNKDVAGPRAHGLRRKFGLQLQVELIHLHFRRGASMSAVLGNRENDKEQNGKCAARHGGYRFGEQVDDGDEEERQRDQAEADGDLHSANMKIKRYLELALPWPRVPEDEDGQAVHRKTPDHSESVEVCEKSDIAAAYENRDDLQCDDDVYDPVAGAESRMRLPEPRAENTVLGNAV